MSLPPHTGTSSAASTAAGSSCRPLLPKLAAGANRRLHGSYVKEGTASPLSNSAPLVRKPKKAVVACDQCRARRTRCDNQRPACSPCARLGQACTYRSPGQADGLKRKHHELQATSQGQNPVLDLLRNAPDAMATTLLQHLRTGTSMADLLGMVGFADRASLPNAFLDPKLGRSVAMPTTWTSTLEFFLNTRYPGVFPNHPPLQLASIDLRLLGIDSTQTSRARRAKKARRMQREVTSPYSAASASTSNHSSPASQPASQPAQTYIDPRLEYLDIRPWTDVPISNELAARVISHYLTVEHPLVAPFHADLFLRDALSGGGRFCSPLLVSALLACCCVTYAQFDPGAREISRLLLDEAKIRWATDEQRESTTGISATVLMTMACNHHGEDLDGVFYLDAGLEMARKWGLFGGQYGPGPSLHGEDEDGRNAASFMVWGLFVWHTLHALYFQRQHAIESPPSLPIPDSRTLPGYMGETFTWTCKLFVSIHPLLRHPDFHKGGLALSLRQTEEVYQNLLSYFDSAPDSIAWSEACPHHVLILHIWYHTTIMDLWRPFLKADAEDGPLVRLRSFPLVVDNRPTAAYNASLRQLKHLVYDYRARFEASQKTVLASPGYLYLINEVYRDCNTRDAQFYFMLAMRAYLTLMARSPVMTGVAKAFFSLGWETGVIQRLGWAERLLEDMQAVDDGGTNYRSLYRVDLVRGREGVEAGSMGNLARGFERLAIEVESKTAEQEEEDEAGDGGEQESGGGGGQGLPYRTPGVWTGTVADLNLTLSEAAEADDLLSI